MNQICQNLFYADPMTSYGFKVVKNRLFSFQQILASFGHRNMIDDQQINEEMLLGPLCSKESSAHILQIV